MRQTGVWVRERNTNGACIQAGQRIIRAAQSGHRRADERGLMNQRRPSISPHKPSKVMTPKPTTPTTRVANRLAGMPTRRKSWTRMYLFPVESSWAEAAMLGKPETGRPMAAEAVKVVAMMSRRGCGCARLLPT